jgi:hypothetical protein
MARQPKKVPPRVFELKSTPIEIDPQQIAHDTVLMVHFMKAICSILLSIVDALHDKDGDAGTWKPIRDAIEKL